MSLPDRKRAAVEEMARASVRGNEGSGSSKRARFDARNPSTLAQEEPDEEDAILELDEIGKGGLQAKRNAVRLEGYESDSSNENFDSRAEAKAEDAKREKRAQKKSEDEEDNDMFAELEEENFEDGDEDEDLAREGKKKRKEVRFMDAKKIEGQVSSSKGGGHVSADFALHNDGKSHGNDHESSSDESGDDEERDRMTEDVDEELGAGSKKKHAPKLDAFNMRNEAEEGQFDESGNFVRKATDPYAVHDSWLEGSSKADMRRAKEAEEQREAERRAREVADDAVPTSKVLGRLIENLETGESVLEALARLGGSKDKKKKPKWQKNRRKHGEEMQIEGTAASQDPAEQARRQKVETITAAADQLLTRGQTEIYEAERAALMRQYRRETGEDWLDSKRDSAASAAADNKKLWEYRWADARDGGESHGPYDGPTMEAWEGAGYFGEGVEYREVGGGSWSARVQFS